MNGYAGATQDHKWGANVRRVRTRAVASMCSSNTKFVYYDDQKLGYNIDRWNEILFHWNGVTHVVFRGQTSVFHSTVRPHPYRSNVTLLLLWRLSLDTSAVAFLELRHEIMFLAVMILEVFPWEGSILVDLVGKILPWRPLWPIMRAAFSITLNHAAWLTLIEACSASDIVVPRFLRISEAILMTFVSWLGTLGGLLLHKWSNLW